MIVLNLILPEPIPLLNVWQRWHWAKRKRVTRGFAWMVLEALGSPWNKEPIQYCEIYIERHSNHRTPPDEDGLILKPLLDSLVVPTRKNPHGLGIIKDDGPDVIKKQRVVPVQCKKGEGKTILKITEIKHEA